MHIASREKKSPTFAEKVGDARRGRSAMKNRSEPLIAYMTMKVP